MLKQLNTKIFKFMGVVLVVLLIVLLSTDIKLSIMFIGAIFLVISCYKPIIWIYFILTYVTFEVVILNFIPTGMVAMVRYGSEAVSYVILMYSIFLAIIKKKKIKFHKYDLCILLFLIFSVITSLVNRVDIKVFILGLRWIVRYVVIYYIFKFNDFNEREIKGVVNYFYKLIIFEVFLGLFQFVFREKLDVILAPKVIDLDFYTITMDKINSNFSIYATFGRYGEYGYFLTLAVLFLFSKYFFEKKKKYLWLLGFAAVALIFSYARQAVLAVGVALLLFIFFSRKVIFNSKLKVFGALIFVFMLGATYILYSNFEVGRGTTTEGIAQRFLSIFSKDFIIGDYYGQGRTYFYTTVNKTFLSTKPLLGYGVGMYGTQAAIDYNTSVYTMLNIPIKFSMDVYVTSILGQVGLIGVILLYSCYYSFYKSCKKDKSDKYLEFISLYIRLTFIAIMICSFFGSNLSDRYQAFYVWMFFGIYDNLKNTAIKKSSLNVLYDNESIGLN